MSIHFHPVRIREVRRETASCVSLLLDIPPALQSSFQYNHGQSLTVRSIINGEEVRRTYSLCSSPLDNEWRIAVKRVDGGLFSNLANDSLRAGDSIEVMEPIGRFYTDLDAANQKKYLAIAAGSGITPILSIIKTTLATEPKSHFTLVYGNRSRQDIIFLEELEGLKNRYLNRLQLLHILSREQVDSPILQGRIDENKLNELTRVISFSEMNEAFLCGPESLIFSAKAFLEKSGLEGNQIHFELFTTPGQQTKSVNTAERTVQFAAASKVQIRLDGRSMEFEIPEGSEQTVLDAALAFGADLPYACKGGVCCTCKAKLVEGEVSMDVHWGLDEEEIKKGYILTCQSHPKTDRVLVDFDDR